MATELRLPQFSMGTTEGTVAHWIKQVGETVNKDEPVVEIETSKVTSEVTAESSGVLLQILVPEGETVPVRTVLCLIGSPGEVTVGGEAEKSAFPPANIQASLREVPGPVTPPGSNGPPVEAAVQVTPVARRLAKEHGLDLGKIKGSGPNGRITIEDVEQAIAAKATPQVSPEQAAPGQVTPVARRLAKDHNIDLAQVKGSGPSGRIVEKDVEQAIATIAVLAGRLLS